MESNGTNCNKVAAKFKSLVNNMAQKIAHGKLLIATYVLFAICVFVSLFGIIEIASSEDITSSPTYASTTSTKQIEQMYNISNYGSYCIIESFRNTSTDPIIPTAYKGVKIMAIAANAFSFTKINSITIPTSIAEIRDRAFYCCKSLTSINYLGTVSQWRLVSKGTSWAYGVGTSYVTCTDGTLLID